MRRILLIAGIVLGAAAAAVTALLLLVDANRFRSPIQAQLQRSLDRPVAFGRMGLSLLPLSIRIADLRNGESPAFRPSYPFASAKEVNVRVSLAALVRGQVAVRSLRLVEPVVELIRSEKGYWNYASLGGERSSSGRPVVIDDLQIVDGSVAVTRLDAGQPRTVFQHIDFRLRDLAPGKRARFDLSFRLPESSGQAVAFQGHGAGLSDFEGRLSLKPSALSGLQRFLGSGGSEFDARIAGDADLRGEKGLLLATGKLSMDQPRLRGSALGFGIQADYQLGYDSGRERLEIRSLAARLGTTAVSASGEVDLKAKPSQAVFNAVARNASLAELARLAGIPGEIKGLVSLETRTEGALSQPDAWVWTGSGSLANASVASPSLAKPVGIRSARVDFRRQGSASNVQFQVAVDELSFVRSSGPSSTTGSASKPRGLENVSGKGNLSIGTLRYGDLVLTQVQAGCTIEGGLIRLAPVTARLYGGQQGGSIVIDLRRSHPGFAVNTRLEQVDANQLLSATTSLKQTLYGLLAANAAV